MRMRASCPERLLENKAKGWPDVLKFTDFRERYCVVRNKPVAGRDITVVFGGRNEAELRARLEGLYLRRTQADVGIQPPSYDYLPLMLDATQRIAMQSFELSMDALKVKAALDDNATDDIDMHLGTHRRALGEIKAHLVVAAAKDAFEDGVPKLVIAYWHKSVGDILEAGLRDYGVVRVDGSSSAKTRENCEVDFRRKDKRVFLAQIEAAGEAIDLSPANELWFCETTFRPKDMHQMALRITNVAAQRNCFVKVCTIDGSLDEAMQRCVMRLWSSIRQVVN
jgi:hypothetical protein